MIGEIIGQEISVNVPKNMKAQVIPQGDIEQATREGYNLLPPFESTTLNGITYTKNEDGTITVKGTATDNSFYRQEVSLKAGDYILTGSPSGAEDNKYCIQATEYGLGDFGEGQSFKLEQDTIVPIRLMVWSGITVNNLVFKPMIVKGTEKKDYEQYGISPSLNYPSVVKAVGNSGSIKILHSNKNLLEFESQTGHGITYNKNRITIINPDFYLVNRNGTIFNNKFLSGKTVTFTYIINGEITGNNYIDIVFSSNKNTYRVQNPMPKGSYNNTKFTKTITLASDEYFYRAQVWTAGTTCNLTVDIQVEINNSATNIVEHKGNIYDLPLQKSFYKIDNYSDIFVKEDEKWYEKHYIKELSLTGNDSETWTAKIIDTFSKYQWSRALSDKLNILNSQIFCTHFKQITVAQLDALNIEGIANGLYPDYSLMIVTDKIKSLADFKTKLKELYESGNPIKIYYILKTPELIECTEEQTQILEQLNSLYLYEGINYLYSTDEISPIFKVFYDKIVNDFRFYLSENGKLVFPNENISFLCSISESLIPSMPEALETSAVIAGRDGDVPLNTTYNPLSFELVLYTEDNLMPEEKLNQEEFLTKFCNSIKNNTETFALELAQKFYKIKYNGLLSKENYPKFLKFTLPFKSSKPFAYNIKEKIIYGNSIIESNTIEPTGFKCVIKGPALKPIISLNDYAIEYDNTILEGESLEIDSNNSTVVLVNLDGIKINAMRYYNHQFPKIINGTNELKVLSGIDNPKNVSISWYDLTL